MKNIFFIYILISCLCINVQASNIDDFSDLDSILDSLNEDENIEKNIDDFTGLDNVFELINQDNKEDYLINNFTNSLEKAAKNTKITSIQEEKLIQVELINKEKEDKEIKPIFNIEDNVEIKSTNIKKIEIKTIQDVNVRDKNTYIANKVGVLLKGDNIVILSYIINQDKSLWFNIESDKGINGWISMIGVYIKSGDFYDTINGIIKETNRDELIIKIDKKEKNNSLVESNINVNDISEKQVEKDIKELGFDDNSFIKTKNALNSSIIQKGIDNKYVFVIELKYIILLIILFNIYYFRYFFKSVFKKVLIKIYKIRLVYIIVNVTYNKYKKFKKIFSFIKSKNVKTDNKKDS